MRSFMRLLIIAHLGLVCERLQDGLRIVQHGDAMDINAVREVTVTCKRTRAGRYDMTKDSPIKCRKDLSRNKVRVFTPKDRCGRG